jgi:uncharacterized Tic20 family protein
MSDTPNTPSPAAPLSEAEDRQWGSFAHLGGILGILPALIIWLIFRERGAFTNTEGKEALNFQITIILASIALGIVFGILSVALWFLAFFLAFLPYLPWIASLIFSILGFLKSKEGEHYRYPVSLRLIK